VHASSQGYSPHLESKPSKMVDQWNQDWEEKWEAVVKEQLDH
jgi:hypothetical protein